MSRRKPGTLVPLETEILGAALSMQRSGEPTFHGFGLARTMGEQRGSRALTGHGTLYKALSRLEKFGLLVSRWEDTEAAEGRPRRRLYELTGEGARVAEQALAGSAPKVTGRVVRSPPEDRPLLEPEGRDGEAEDRPTIRRPRGARDGVHIAAAPGGHAVHR
jgi:PadR family transcriptional regulator PadR